MRRSIDGLVPLWPATSAGVAISLFVAISIPANAGYVSSTNCVDSWYSTSCVTLEGDAREPYVRHVTEPLKEADKARAAEREQHWRVRCQPVVTQDRYGVPRYRYAAPGCEFGFSDN